MVNLVTAVLQGEAPSQVFILQLLNTEKNIVENLRPWQVLKKLDTSVTVQATNTYTNPLPLPADFSKFLLEGTMQLFDGVNDTQNISQVPFEARLTYRTAFGRFLADYANNQFFLMGLIPKAYSVYLWYIKSTPQITLGTTWTSFPPQYQAMLAFRTAARWRLGTDFDDVNARNADENGRTADMILQSMETWDTDLAISAINSVDYRNDNYPGPAGGQGPTGSWYGPRGPRALN